jgi:hypothetical protein
MASQSPPVLDESDLNDTDDRLINLLHTGRVTPQYAADHLDVSRTYSSERLKRLVEHNHVNKIAGGLYELTNDPRPGNYDDTTKDDLRARHQDALEARDNAQARADRLESELEETVDRLEAARTNSVDVQAARTALDDIEAAAERGDGTALQDALRRAREALND